MGSLANRTLLPPRFIFSDEELEDTLLGLDPLTAHGCTAISTHQSFHLHYKTSPEPILSGSKKTNQKAWKVQIQQEPQPPDIIPASIASSAFGGKIQSTRQTDDEYVQFSVRQCPTAIPLVSEYQRSKTISLADP